MQYHARFNVQQHRAQATTALFLRCSTRRRPICHFRLHSPHATLNTSHSTLDTLQFTLYTLHSTRYTLHCALYTPDFTLSTPHLTTTPHSKLPLHFTLNYPHSTFHTATPHSTLGTPHSTIYTLHSTQPTPHFTLYTCLLYTSPSPRDGLLSRMPSSA